MLNISSARQTFALRLWGCTYLLLILPFKSADEKTWITCFFFQLQSVAFSQTVNTPSNHVSIFRPDVSFINLTQVGHLCRMQPMSLLVWSPQDYSICHVTAPVTRVHWWHHDAIHTSVGSSVRPSICSEVRRQKQDKLTVHRITAYQHSGIILNSSLVFSLGRVLWQVERQLAFLRRCAQLLPHYLHRGIVWQFQVVHARHHWRQVIVWILRRFHCLSHNGQRRIQTAETYKQNQSREKNPSVFLYRTLTLTQGYSFYSRGFCLFHDRHGG